MQTYSIAFSLLAAALLPSTTLAQRETPGATSPVQALETPDQQTLRQLRAERAEIAIDGALITMAASAGSAALAGVALGVSFEHLCTAGCGSSFTDQMLAWTSGISLVASGLVLVPSLIVLAIRGTKILRLDAQIANLEDELRVDLDVGGAQLRWLRRF